MVEGTLTLGLPHCTKGLFGLVSNGLPRNTKKPNEFERVEFVRLFY